MPSKLAKVLRIACAFLSFNVLDHMPSSDMQHLLSHAKGFFPKLHGDTFYARNLMLTLIEDAMQKGVDFYERH